MEHTTSTATAEYAAQIERWRRQMDEKLRAPDGCTVDIFEQGKAVTVGFANCASRCTRGASDYLWPILVDRTNGQCH